MARLTARIPSNTNLRSLIDVNEMSAEPQTHSINLAECNAAEVNQRLRNWNTSVDGSHITITPAISAQGSLPAATIVHGFAAGLNRPLTIQVAGELGDFACMLSEQAEIEVNGSIGSSAGHSLTSGYLLINGNAGDNFGAYATGGVIACIGRAGARCGLGLAGGDVVVRSDVGDEAAMGMTGGSLILGNSAGDHLGAGMRGGTVYVRGTVKSLAPGVREYRLKESDTMRLSLLLARAGIRAAAKEFRVYRPNSSGGVV